jgi:hypothetical protein
VNPARPYDIAVIGAGAAGLVAALTSARENPNAACALFEKSQPGTKIKISGGGRCNLTNARVDASDYHGGLRRVVDHVLKGFSAEKTRIFFESLGVAIVCQDHGKCFPKRQSGSFVAAALMEEVRRRKVDLRENEKIVRIEKKTFPGSQHSFLFCLIGSKNFFARRVIVATGGLACPKLGAEGIGYQMARQLGHAIVTPHPALTPLLTNDPQWKALSGISLPVVLTFYKKGRKAAEVAGALLFTHTGFSGPAILDISRYLTTSAAGDQPAIFANFVPGSTDRDVRDLMENSSHSAKSMRNLIKQWRGLPVRLIDALLEKCGAAGDKRWRDCPAAQRKKIVESLLRYPLPVSGFSGFDRAEVTAGGVSLNEVNSSTLESKIQPGLYFAGEILDVNGRIGGFNLQWAWSSGAVAGRAAARSIL